MAGETGLAAFLLRWHGVGRRSGPAGLRRSLAQLQGAALPVSDLETAILPARLADYSTAALDRLLNEGGHVWQGHRPLGGHDGEIALYRTPDFARLGRISVFASGSREQQLRDALLAEPGLSFEHIRQRLGGFADDLLKTLWRLAWNGEVTSDSLDALRARRSAGAARYHRRPRPRYTTRKRVLPGAAGHWRLLCGPFSGFAPEPERSLARARQLLDRYGVLSRALFAGEEPGFDRLSSLLEVLAARGEAEHRALPDGGQFLAPGAGALWDAGEADAGAGYLSACDPANAWGACAPWPSMVSGYRPQRTGGARVLLEGGRLLGYVTRTGRELHTPLDGADASRVLAVLVRFMPAPVFLERVNDDPPYRTPWHDALRAAGFSPSPSGYLLRAGR